MVARPMEKLEGNMNIDIPEYLVHIAEQQDEQEAKLDRILALLEPKPKARNSRQKLVSEYWPEFEEAWEVYPKRAGTNPKRSAHAAFQARIRAGETFSVLRDGVVAYRAYCDATGITGSSYVMQAARFFGPNQEYLNEWIAPAPKAALPKTEAEWLAVGKIKGIEPRVGEAWRDYQDRLRSAL